MANERAAVGPRSSWSPGASSGVGRAVAMSSPGRSHRRPDRPRRGRVLAATAAEVNKLGGIASVAPTDVGDAAAVDAAASDIEDSLGPIDSGSTMR